MSGRRLLLLHTGPNHLKNLCLLNLYLEFAFFLFYFIAASHIRGADHVVGLNFIPIKRIKMSKNTLLKELYTYIE